MADNEARSIGISLDDMSQLGFSANQKALAGGGQLVEESLSNAMTNNVYGINHRQTPLAVPLNRDRYGYTFFTRPQLNLQDVNLRNIRRMYPLLTTKQNSYLRIIRCLLDPRILHGYSVGRQDDDRSVQPLVCDLVDNYNPFISVLTNQLTSISGWPDLDVQTFTGRPGPYKEEWSIADGTTIDYSAYNVTATFRNSRGDPISSLFSYWANYMSYAFEGVLSPYPDFIIENEIDYNTRIYRLVMDPTNRVVTRIAACGAAFPIGNNTGTMYDFDSTKPYNDANSEITIPFRCMGFIENDDILIRTFNRTVQIFNPSMKDGPREGGEMTLIPQNLLDVMNNRGAPRINPKTRVLEWWMYTPDYEARLQAYQNLDSALDNVMGLNLIPTA